MYFRSFSSLIDLSSVVFFRVSSIFLLALAISDLSILTRFRNSEQSRLICVWMPFTCLCDRVVDSRSMTFAFGNPLLILISCSSPVSADLPLCRSGFLDSLCAEVRWVQLVYVLFKVGFCYGMLEDLYVLLWFEERPTPHGAARPRE